MIIDSLELYIHKFPLEEQEMSWAFLNLADLISSVNNTLIEVPDIYFQKFMNTAADSCSKGRLRRVIQGRIPWGGC